MPQIIYKFKPFSFESVEYRDWTKVPKPRSGHRIVTTDSDLYSFGGYNPEIDELDAEMLSDNEWTESRPLFREFWRFSFITNEWTRLPICDNTPKELVSHCATLIEDKYLVVFGGTAFPFGHTSSNKIFVVNLETNEWQRIECNNSDQNECPIEQYGQALTIDTSSDNLYAVGGTTGYEYTIDVHKFDLRSCLWQNIYRKPMRFYEDFPQERYRHEVVFYDNRLYVLGGGTSVQCFPLSKIPVFELETKEWSEMQTINDINVLSAESDGYPCPRRCHDCVRIENNVYVLGGTDGRKIFDDLWKLDLITLKWTQIAVRIPRGLYFHSAFVSPSGRLSIFGGVTNVNHRDRSNHIYTSWLKIPPLKVLSFEAILFYIKTNNLPINESLLKLELPPNYRQRIRL